MARSHHSFNKRQRELAKKEKRKKKLERREERKESDEPIGDTPDTKIEPLEPGTLAPLPGSIPTAHENESESSEDDGDGDAAQGRN